VRVSGTTGQESSLAAQEEELRASSTGEVVGVFRDRASGLREHRPGLDRVLAMAQAGQISVAQLDSGRLGLSIRDRLSGAGELPDMF